MRAFPGLLLLLGALGCCGPAPCGPSACPPHTPVLEDEYIEIDLPTAPRPAPAL